MKMRDPCKKCLVIMMCKEICCLKRDYRESIGSDDPLAIKVAASITIFFIFTMVFLISFGIIRMTIHIL